MMRCSNCGNQGTANATFCLNCGTRLGHTIDDLRLNDGTASASPGLPKKASIPTPVPGAQPATDNNVKVCTGCNAENSPTMKFCRQCGSTLPHLGKGPMGGRTLLSAPPVMMPAASAPAVAAAPVAISNLVVAATPALLTPTPEVAPAPVFTPAPVDSAPVKSSTSTAASVQECDSCHKQTPAGFSFCQLCGKPLAATAVAPAVVAPAVVAPAAVAPAIASALGEPRVTSVGGAGLSSPNTNSEFQTTSGPIWGNLISVTRSGVDGDTHALRGDYVEIGRSKPSHLCFDDPYLATTHARLERLGAGTCQIVPMDSINGVFLRVRTEKSVVSGDTILLGRQLLRFDLLQPAEAAPRQLVQHGVSRFGSPLREAWARLSLMLPNGGVRDVRYLHQDEVVLGREEGEICFREDGFLSRRHATLCWNKGVCTLTDLGSANGTFLRIGEAANLSDGDALRIGDQMFRYHPVG